MLDRLQSQHVKDLHGLIANIRKKINNLINVGDLHRVENYIGKS